MADEMTVKGVIYQELTTAGYNPTEAWWIADEWAPRSIGYQWSGEQVANWLYGSGLLTVGPDPDNPGNWINVPGETRSAINRYRAAMGRGQVMAANREVQERLEQETTEQQARAEWQRQRQIAEQQRQRQIAERVELMGGLAPTEAELTAPFLEQARGVSPAFQRIAEQRLLPDIFAELGMPQRRREWWEKGTQRIAEQLLPETEQEKELMAMKRADPWAQLLSQPTFLRQLETRFRGLSPGERGVSMGRFRPRTRFLS